MGQWDPELRASAEARQAASKQASKQKARQSSDWQGKERQECAQDNQDEMGGGEKREQSRRTQCE